ncbi:hypothetical protein POM88_025165 [Heracleum sosnowskyi]|uniref:Uncharacterized protein n=1 Tax=Heracleum sosnowskyi TaxID=360622 RepID=A0AAD8MM64_9APIA|nr:hypothetical protein POM88_025165 [Heracleum sosnowskyi]
MSPPHNHHAPSHHHQPPPHHHSPPPHHHHPPPHHRDTVIIVPPPPPIRHHDTVVFVPPPVLLPRSTQPSSLSTPLTDLTELQTELQTDFLHFLMNSLSSASCFYHQVTVVEFQVPPPPYIFEKECHRS